MDKLSPEQRRSFERLAASAQLTPIQLMDVLGRFQFAKGPPLSSFRRDPATEIREINPILGKSSIRELESIRHGFLRLIENSSTSNVPITLLWGSPIADNGVAQAELFAKRLVVKDFQTAVTNFLKKKRWVRFARIGLASVVVVVLAVLLAPHAGRSALDQAFATVAMAKGQATPASFAESIAMIRASGRPLIRLDLENASIPCQDLSKLDLRRLFAIYMDATGISFDSSNLAFADLSFAQLSNAKLRNVRMDDARFINASLIAANLYKAEARSASFDSAALQAANMDGGDFTGTSFVKSNFMLADMRSAKFVRANFENAVLDDADLSGSDFSGAKNLHQAAIDLACFDPHLPPVFDSGLRPPKRSCYDEEKTRTDRLTRRGLIGFIGGARGGAGYCKGSTLLYTTSKSALHPEDDTPVYIDFSGLTDPKE